MDQLQALKEQISQLRQENPGRKVHLPVQLWDQIKILSETIPCNRLAEELTLNYQNLRRQIKKRKKTQISTPRKKMTFLEVPQKNLLQSAKQVTLELPHGINLRIEL